MTSKKKATRTRYSEEFKADAVACAERLGVAAAARELGLHASQLYDWRRKRQAEGEQQANERALADENARLKRELADRDEELAILKKASAYFARNQK